MWQKNIACYLGQERENGFSGFISEENFFLILEVEEGLNGDKGREALKIIKEEVISSPIESLSAFEERVNIAVQKTNLPTGFSLSAAWRRDNVLYLKTAGLGQIYLRRDRDFAKIIERENTASGRLGENDFFIFTTEGFTKVIGGETEIKTIFNHKTPHAIVEEITPILKGRDETGIVALFVQFGQEETFTEERSFVSEPKPWEKLFKSERLEGNKKLTLAVVIVIFLILVWSVGFGYQRRSSAAMDKKISTTRALIKQKLQQADKLAFLNLPKSLVLISEAKQEVDKLKKEFGNQKTKEVSELLSFITAEENKIVKKEERNAEEFFDLTIDNKSVQGNQLYLYGDQLVILDKAQGGLYSLSLTKKSLDKSSFNEIKKAKLIASYQGGLFFFIDNEGIYKIDADKKLKKAIDKDSDWGNITALKIYNGNIYLLDAGRDSIYKYLVAEGGYSGKTSYFKGSAAGLREANSMAIDGSVYVGFSDKLFKFTSGEQDDFRTSFPDSSFSLNKADTSRDLEKVYVWDKKNGAIYVLAKNGTYEREINSSILSKADDFTVYGNAAYVLAGPKIYKINLD